MQYLKKHIHLIRQHDEKDCGAACLSMILEYYGLKLPLATVREAIKIDKDGANMLFQLINRRYEKKPIIVTTNIPFGRWSELFGDSVIANAILDRLLHHSHIFNITGRSYRTKDIVDLDEEKKD